MHKFLKYASYILVLVGALNWGLIGIFNFDLVAFLFKDMSIITRSIYVIVGISAFISPVTCYHECKHIKKEHEKSNNR